MTLEQDLQREIAALEHELRRVRDSIERNPSHDLERRARHLRDSIALCQQDLVRAPNPQHEKQ